MADKDKVLQEKYMEFKLVQHQIEKIREQVQAFETQVEELGTVGESLDKLEKMEHGTEILVPISGGVFITAAIKDAQHVAVNVGAGTVVQKKCADARKLMTGQIEEILKYREDLMGQLAKLIQHAKSLQAELKGLVG